MRTVREGCSPGPMITSLRIEDRSAPLDSAARLLDAREIETAGLSPASRNLSAMCSNFAQPY
jgi:hypothetical protein